MTTLILPDFMTKNINPEHIDFEKNSAGEIKLNNIRSINDIASSLKGMLEDSHGRVFLDEDSNFKKNVMIIHNDDLLSHETLNQVIFCEDDIVELMVQFAGG